MTIEDSDVPLPPSAASTPIKSRPAPHEASSTPGTPSVLTVKVSPPAPPPTPVTELIADDDERDSKEADIHTCLSGSLDEAIDLIQLRRLAVSTGGLKTIAFRRQAWPKLVAAHEVLWEGVNNNNKTSREPRSTPTEDLKFIQRLVRRTKWSKHQITQSPKTFDELLGLVLSSGSPTIAPPTASLMSSSNLFDIASPTILSPPPLTSHVRRVSFDMPLEDEQEEAPSNNSPSRRERARLLQVARDERQVLQKLLTHLQRIYPDFVLYDGLQNLLAVLWIVLESPSLTSVTSLQLAQYHWQRPADEDDLFLQVLHLWDPILYDHLRSLGYHETPSCIANSWIPHWLAQDLRDLGILLRIWDVLIVSPPIAIVYFSVALTVHFRDPLLRAKQQPIFQAILQHLPSDGLEKYDDRVVEIILEECLMGLEEYPLPPAPSMALSPARNKQKQQAPSWFTASTAPSDWQVLKRLGQLRQEGGSVSEDSSLTSHGLDLPTTDTEQTVGARDLGPFSPPIIVSTSNLTTPRAFPSMPMEAEDGSSLETPDATPCSTPESTGAPLATKLKKAPRAHETFWSVLRVIVESKSARIALGCFCAFVAIVLGCRGLWAVEISRELKAHAALSGAFVPLDNFPLDPDPIPEQSGVENTKTSPALDAVSIDTNVKELLQKYGREETIARGIQSSEQAFLPPIEINIERLWADNTFLSEESDRAKLAHSILPPIETKVDSFLEPIEEGSTQAETPGCDMVDDFTLRVDSSTSNSSAYNDEDITEPSSVPTVLDRDDQGYGVPSADRPDDSPNSFSRLLAVAGRFVMESTQTHLLARDHARQLLDSARSQSVVAVAKAGAESHLAIAIAVEETKKQAKTIRKALQAQHEIVARLAWEGTRARLDARVAALDRANHAALTVLGASKKLTLVGLDRSFDILLSSTNSTLNLLGRGARLVEHNRQHASSVISKALIRARSRLNGIGHGTVKAAALGGKTAALLLTEAARTFVKRSVQGIHNLDERRRCIGAVLASMSVALLAPMINTSHNVSRRAKRGLHAANLGRKQAVHILRRSGQLAVLSTNATLNVIGTGARFGSTAAEVGMLSIRNGSRKSLEASLGAVARGRQLLRIGARKCASATRHGGAHVFEALGRAYRSAEWVYSVADGVRTASIPVRSKALGIVKSASPTLLYRLSSSPLSANKKGDVDLPPHRLHPRRSKSRRTRGVADFARDAMEESKKQAETVRKESQAQHEIAARLAWEGTRARLDARVAALDRANHAALTVLGTSKKLTLVGLDRSFDILLSSTNSTLNLLGRGARLVEHNRQHASSVISKALIRARSRLNGIGHGTVKAAALGGKTAALLLTEAARTFVKRSVQGIHNLDERRRCIGAVLASMSVALLAPMINTSHNVSRRAKRGLHAANLGRKQAVHILRRSGQLAVLSTNATLNVIGTGARFGSTAAEVGMLSIRNGSRKSLEASLGAVARGRQLLRIGARKCASATRHGGAHVFEALGRAYRSAEWVYSVADGVRTASIPVRSKALGIVKSASPTLLYRLSSSPLSANKKGDVDLPPHRLHPRRSKSRRTRGAADFARDALRRENDSTFAGPAAELSPLGNRVSKSVGALSSTRDVALLRLEAWKDASAVLRRIERQSVDVIFGGVSQCALMIAMVGERSLLSIQQRVQAAVGRTKDLARFCLFAFTAIRDTVSRFLDNMVLKTHYALSVVEMSRDARSPILLIQEVDRILALRKARELVAYNTLLFVAFAKIQLHRSSERQISAVLQANTEAWKLIQKSADIRIEGMEDARHAIVGSIAKAKDFVFGRFQERIGRF